MTEEFCLNLLRVMDGREEPSNKLIQLAKAYNNPEKLHNELRVTLLKAGWTDGGARTQEDALLTPHVREWENLVKAQRDPVRALQTMTVKATYQSPAKEATDEAV